jgi:hypothetical protein
MTGQGEFTRKVRALGGQLLVGLILGVGFWEGFGRWILEKKYGSFGSSVTCAPDVKRALADFDAGLRISALAGAGVFVVAVFGFRRWWRKRRPAPPVPPATGAGAP